MFFVYMLSKHLPKPKPFDFVKQITGPKGSAQAFFLNLSRKKENY